jgi:integrase
MEVSTGRRAVANGSPDYVSRRFGALSEAAGLPRIALHAGRHTAATLELEAGVDIKVVSERMGHSTTAITQNLYQHVRRQVHDGAAEAVVWLLPDRRSAGERTG